MSRYADIIERLEAATGPDRELDCWIGYVTDVHIESMGCTFRKYCEVHDMDFAHVAETAARHTSILREYLPLYTASLDAAIGLTERMLPPLTGIELNTYVGGKYHHCEIETETGDYRGDNAPHPSLAVLIAMFRALEAQEVQP